jgi:hypothetical protein
MTAINNLTIEQIREIVNGAPERAERWLNGMYLKQGEWTWWWSSYVNKWLQYEKHIYSNSKFEIAIDLNDLRTIIAEYDSRKFKVDDL